MSLILRGTSNGVYLHKNNQYSRVSRLDTCDDYHGKSQPSQTPPIRGTGVLTTKSTKAFHVTLGHDLSMLETGPQGRDVHPL